MGPGKKKQLYSKSFGMATLQMKSKNRPQEDLREKEKSNLMMKIKATEPTGWVILYLQ